MSKSEICKQMGIMIRANTAGILNEWEALVQASLSKNNFLTKPVLINHLPEVLRNLADAFEHESTHPQKDEQKNKKLAQEHGNQRAVRTTYTLRGVLVEYCILRQVIIKNLFPTGTADVEAALVVHRFLDQACQSAVIEFVSVQQEQLEKTVRELSVEKDVRERFVAAMSHDLKTPLMAAKMSAQIILRRPDSTDLIFKHLPRITSNLDRMDQMIQDLLDASLVRAGGALSLDIHECDLGNIINETMADLISIYGERFIYPENIQIRGYWSCSGLKRVLENLCNNAIKYGSQQEPVKVLVSAHEEVVTISVYNEGNPIDKAELENLFNPFHRSTSAKESGKKGWGLGLTLVRGITEALGGSVNVDSIPNFGTTFIIEIPLDSRPFTSSK
jgi:signal transduction histidine kinase